MSKEIFKTDFSPYACVGDTIEARVSLAGYFTGLRLVATIYLDDCSDRPDERVCGFWPNLNPESAGYIGPKSESTLRKHHRRAEQVMRAWEAGEWFYCGIAVQAWFDDIPLTAATDSHALWGIECNYPNFGRKRNPNAYLREVANELAGECAREAIRKLTELVEAGHDV